MTYTISGTTYESAAAVVNAFISPEADPCTDMADVYGLANDIEDIAANEHHPLSDDDYVALVNALSEYYGLNP